MHAINHPTPHPIAITPTARIELEPSRVSVHRANCGYGGCKTNNNKDVDIRVIPLQERGQKCCNLTIVGGRVMHPGDKVLLHFDFLVILEEEVPLPNGDDIVGDSKVDQHSSPLRCYGESACLFGEERAIGIDGVTKRRTRYNVFDTASAEVEHGYTDEVSLSLKLPSSFDNCPVTLTTDLVEVTVTCRIDVTVGDDGRKSSVGSVSIEDDDIGGDSTGGRNVAYRFLKVEFPCFVVRYAPEDEDDTSGGREGGLAPAVRSKMLHLLANNGEIGFDNDKCHEKFVLHPNVLNDLTMLSLHIIETEGSN